MAKAKTITVPQNGTQPAHIATPIDNMVSGSITKAIASVASGRCPTSFNLDRTTVAQFKAHCAAKHKSMSSVIEKLMQNYIAYSID